MKLIGHLPRWTGGEEVEVDLLLVPNLIVFVMLWLVPYWSYAWRFRALWRYLLWHLGCDLC